MEYFGKKLKIARMEKGYSREKMGERMHLSASAIQHYEEGVRQPGLDVFFQIAAVLEKPLEYFLDDDYSLLDSKEIRNTKKVLEKEDRERLLEFEVQFCNARNEREKAVAILQLLSQYC
ncbi:MAG: helix-turn-helix transcriptional regulator [Lachnospiraceae bacterium]|nr:helix-turn-helix transcriptional regulator [Lachnospiraceae bacterium]